MSPTTCVTDVRYKIRSAGNPHDFWATTPAFDCAPFWNEPSFISMYGVRKFFLPPFSVHTVHALKEIMVLKPWTLFIPPTMTNDTSAWTATHCHEEWESRHHVWTKHSVTFLQFCPCTEYSTGTGQGLAVRKRGHTTWSRRTASSRISKHQCKYVQLRAKAMIFVVSLLPVRATRVCTVLRTYTQRGLDFVWGFLLACLAVWSLALRIAQCALGKLQFSGFGNVFCLFFYFLFFNFGEARVRVRGFKGDVIIWICSFLSFKIPPFAAWLFATQCLGSTWRLCSSKVKSRKWQLYVLLSIINCQLFGHVGVGWMDGCPCACCLRTLLLLFFNPLEFPPHPFCHSRSSSHIFISHIIIYLSVPWSSMPQCPIILCRPATCLSPARVIDHQKKITKN